MTKKSWTLALMCGVVVMTVIDLAVVNTALPSIESDLGAAPADLQWVVVAYAVAVAGFLLLGGRLGDLIGHRTILLAGVAVLSAASLVGGFAGSLEMLIGARAGQGLGAALAAPNALAIISMTFAEGDERNRALGIFAAAGGTAAAGGSLVGGLLTQGPGWEWVFFLNVPIGIALVAAVAARVRADSGEREERARPDVAGALALTGGLVALSLGFHQSVEYGWISVPALLPIALGLGLLGSFLAIESRVRSPLIPLATLFKRSLLWANVAAGFLWAAFLSLIYQATLFLQGEAGYTPLATGAAGLPIAFVSLFVAARLAPAVIARIGAAVTIGSGLAILGGGLLLLLRVPADPAFATDILPAYIVVGLGLGLCEVSVQIAAFTGIEGHESGLAGGANETSREMGGAIGLALLASIVVAGTSSLTDAFHAAVIGGAVFAGLGVLVALFLLLPAERSAARG